MNVVYDSSFQGMVKACILKEVKGYTPVKDIDLIPEVAVGNVKVIDFNLNELFIEWDWLYGTPRNVNALEGALKLASRHKFCTPDLLFTVIKEALTYGVDYVLTRKSYDSKRFCNYVLAVREELRAVKMNLRFAHYGNFLVGKYYFSHDIADLLRDFYQKRFPDKKVMIVGLEHEVPSGIAMPAINAFVERPLAVQAGVSVPQSLTLTSFM